MAILNVIEYQPEGLAIIEDTYGKYMVTKDDPQPVPLELVVAKSLSVSERDRLNS